MAAVTTQPIIRALVANAVSLAGATIVTSVLGLGYWFLAARIFPLAAVGFASAAISGMTLVSSLASLGLGTFAMGEAQRTPARRRELVATVLLASGAGAAVLGLVYALCIPLVSRDLRTLSATPSSVAVFVIGAVATAVGMVLDQALVGALNGRVQLARNIVFGVAKIALLGLSGLAVLSASGQVLFGTWVSGIVVSLAVIALVRSRWTCAFVAAVRIEAVRVFRRDIARWVLRHQVLNVGLCLPLLALPVLVITALSAQASATFYISWQLTNAAFVLPGSLATMLYAVGADSRRALAERLRVTLGLSVVLTLAVGVVLTLGAQPILAIFGEQYARNGTTTLIALTVAGIPTIVKNHYVTVSRVTGRLDAAVPVVYLGAALEMVGSFLGAHQEGLVGFAIGWVLALAIEALLMLPLVIRALRADAPMSAS